MGFRRVWILRAGNNQAAAGLLLSDFLPVGFLGIALAALLSSVMSTIDSHLNYGAQTLLNDVYKPIMGNPSPSRALWIGCLLMILILALCFKRVFAWHIGRLV